MKIREIRPEIIKFAEQMELVMRNHDGEKGDSWKTCEIGYLFRKHDEEYNETSEWKQSYPLQGDDPKDEINYVSDTLQAELLDEAILTMMIFIRLEMEGDR